MKTIAQCIALSACLLTLQPAFAADPKADLQALIGKIQTQLREGKPTEESLAPNLKEFDVLLETHKDNKSDDVAQILMMKAMLYKEVLENEEKAMPLLKQLKANFPDSKQAAGVDRMIAVMEKQKDLQVGKVFPDFTEKDLAGKPLSISQFKGKVVLVDFWATWCGPCIGELPNVLKAYETHHDKGFEIVGISLDSDRAKLDKFIEEKKMTWPQYFDGGGWKTKLAGDYGINSIPATYFLDREGKIVARNLRGPALDEAVAKALAAK